MDSLFFENRDYFAKRIQNLESSLVGSSKKIGELETSTEALDTAVCVRIRPLAEYEVEQEHVKGALTDNYQVVNIYEPRRKVNSKPDLNSYSFTLDQVYDSDKSTRNIYDDRVQELVQWVLDGGTSMLLAYGQTGSGKTFTVTELERLVVQRLMGVELVSKWDVHICIFEIAGSNMYDLLQDRKPIKVLEDAFGTMQLLGILEMNPTTSEEFLNLIDIAKELRSTATTTKNDQSSRSHAICRIRITTKESPTSSEGILTLVDLAGSEASSDTAQHTRERMTETREINKSLSVLKDCIRARALWSIARGEGRHKSFHIPFRSTKLTQVLKSNLDINSTQTCKMIFVACINPSMLDVAHSKNTLRYAEMLRVAMPEVKSRLFDARIPTTWENKDVQEWIKKNVNPMLLAPRENGLQFCRLKEDEFVSRALLTQGVKAEKAKLLYFRLWALHIDSQGLSVSMAEKPVLENTRPLKKDWEKRRVSPGMFFRVEGGVGGEIVMVMGSECVRKKGGRDDGGWRCAVVCEARGVKGAFELFVADQRVVEISELGEEVGLKYNSESRYYYVRD